MADKRMMHDEQLLRQYAENRSEPAFTELVSRHINLVYAVAFRVVGRDRHLAQDVVQTVFTDLSVRAKSLQGIAVLAGWLHQHAFFVASTTVRTEQRRRNRERLAALMNATDDSSGPDWDQLAPILDEALQGLKTSDRDAIVLRYFQGLDLKSVGVALGTNEDTAQKRVSRALEKLRSGISKRGVALTVSSLAMAMAGNSFAAAPVGMAAHITASILAGGGNASGMALTYLKFLAWMKTKTAMVTVTLVFLISVTTTYVLLVRPRRSVNLALIETQTQSIARTAEPRGNGVAPTSGIRNAGSGFHWSQVESADYRKYISNLRAIGCPERILQDIIIADLNQLFAPRMQAIWRKPVRVYWKKYQDASANPDQIRKLKALDQEKAAILKELLGISIDGQALADLAYLQFQPAELQMLFLSADTRAGAQRALQESGIEETMTKMRAANPNSDPEREFFDQKLKVLAQVLSPEELEEFRMRKSPRANWLSDDVRYFNCTKEEFKALLDAREQSLGPDKKDHVAVDGATAIEQVRTLLGDQRALEYERVSDYGYHNGRAAAERIGLPEDLADQAGQIVFETRVAAAETARNTNLPAEERRLEIQRLQTEAEARLSASGLPDAGIRNALRRTIANTAQSIRP